MAGTTSLRDVAEKAGVSVSTVSLVLNERPNVSYKTAQKVRDVISDLGYQGGSRLGTSRLVNGRTRRTKRVGLVLVGQPQVLLATSVYADVVASVENALRRNGMVMVLLCVADSESFAAEIQKQSVDGLILMGDTEMPGVADSVWRYPAVKVMGESQPDGPFDQVLVNPRSVSLAAAKYLHGVGCEACAYIGRGSGVFTARMDGFCEEAKSLGLSVATYCDPDVVRIDATTHLIRHRRLSVLIDRLVAAEPRVTGLMVESDALVTSVYQSLLARGVRPARDVHVVSVNNERNVLTNLCPAPAAIDVQAGVIGERAVDQLLWRIGNRDAGRSLIGLDANIVLPGSVPHLDTFDPLESSDLGPGDTGRAGRAGSSESSGSSESPESPESPESSEGSEGSWGVGGPGRSES